MKLLVLNCPNLNMVGIRERGVYGTKTYTEMVHYIKEVAKERGHDIEVRQSNSEGELIDWIHEAYLKGYEGVIMNPGAYTHYSYAIFDAIKSIAPIPVVEVHLSNVHARESFRQTSVTAPACVGQLCGFGELGYGLAIQALEQAVQSLNG